MLGALIDRLVIRASRHWPPRRRRKFLPQETLLLFSICLQRTACSRNIRSDLGQCQRCGACPVGSLLAVAEKYRIRTAVATGGQLALAEARRPEITLVIAIACHKELREGILASWPKKVWAVSLEAGALPCRDSGVKVAEVEEALRQWLTCT